MGASSATLIASAATSNSRREIGFPDDSYDSDSYDALTAVRPVAHGPHEDVAGVTGVEPVASGFGDRRSGRLSYTPSMGDSLTWPTGPSPRVFQPVTGSAGRRRAARKSAPDHRLGKIELRRVRASRKLGQTLSRTAPNAADIDNINKTG